eukprot:12963505-Alexandrium_andersonii.AAC.1
MEALEQRFQQTEEEGRRRSEAVRILSSTWSWTSVGALAASSARMPSCGRTTRGWTRLAARSGH